MPDRKLRVFLCHASQDKPIVRELYQRLLAEGWIDPWLDEKELIPGQDWGMEIEKAVESSDAVIVCLSNTSIAKSGYVQRELRAILDKALEKPEGVIYVVPLRLDDCQVPHSLKNLQWVDYFETAAYEKLLQSFQACASRIGLIVFPGMQGQLGSVEFVNVPAGKFLIGSLSENKLAFPDEKPQHTFEIPYNYLITRFEITNVQFAKYVEQANAKSKSSARKWRMFPDLPVVNISWYEALRFCQWLTDHYHHHGHPDYLFRLPTEAEWEMAARGEDGREWPWGNQFLSEKRPKDIPCNCQRSKIGKPTPVEAYIPGGYSPYHVADMIGNVWEWTQSLLRSYPYDPCDGRENLKTPGERVIRGGSFDTTVRSVRITCRSRLNPEFSLPNVGFRIVFAPPLHNR